MNNSVHKDEDEDDNFSEIDPAEHTSTQNTLLDKNYDIQYLDLPPAEFNFPQHILYNKYCEEVAYPTVYMQAKDGSILSFDYRTM